MRLSVLQIWQAPVPGLVEFLWEVRMSLIDTVASKARPSSLAYEELLAAGLGTLLPPGSPLLPQPPMLMFDRITRISEERDEKSKFVSGLVQAELDLHPDLWFFKCHFKDNPIMPGCLQLDALLQMAGFFLAWQGALGEGFAAKTGDGHLRWKIRPSDERVFYEVRINRTSETHGGVFARADGEVKVIHAKGSGGFEITCDVKGMFVGGAAGD